MSWSRPRKCRGTAPPRRSPRACASSTRWAAWTSSSSDAGARLEPIGERRVLTDPRRPLRELSRRVDEATERLRRALRATIQRVAHRVELATRDLRERSPVARTRQDRRRLDDLAGRLDRALARGLDRRRHRLVGVAGRLDSLSPLAVLGPASSLPPTPPGATVRGARQGG